MDLIERPRDLELVQRACDILLKIPGVFSVGLGSKLVNGVSTGKLAFSILVLEKKPVAKLAPHEIIPAEIEGLPTDILESQPPRLIADEEQEDFDSGIVRDTDEYRPILGGIQIRGARSITDTGAHSFGTLGGFALTTGKDAGLRVLLTNHHVLNDRDGNLHGPSCTGCTKGDAVGNPNSGSQIATVLRGNDGDEVDAAIAILDKGVQFQRDIVKDDAPFPHREAIGASRPLETTDVDGTVHKRGMRTRITYGIVGSVSATTPPVQGGRQRRNQIRIDLERKVGGSRDITFETGNRIHVEGADFIAAGVNVGDVAFIQAPAVGRFRITEVVDANRLELDANLALPSGTGPTRHTLFVTPPLFALKGDSGALLMDANGHVVGLVWAAFTESVFGNAWASRIERVEDLLRIRIDSASAVGDTQVALAANSNRPAGDALLAAPIAAGDVAPAGSLRALVEDDLMQAPRGRQIHQLYFAHQTEVRELIDSNRDVALVWHRQGGPGMIQSVLNAARSHSTEIPTAIRGRSWGERVHAILAVFARFGSSRLREDIVCFGREIEMLGGMTYPRFLQSLKALSGS